LEILHLLVDIFGILPGKTWPGFAIRVVHATTIGLVTGCTDCSSNLSSFGITLQRQGWQTETQADKQYQSQVFIGFQALHKLSPL
jgi:hypothetical protein